MHRTGHYGMALLAYAPVATLTIAVDQPLLCVGGAAVVLWGAMLPDLDMRVPGLTHRGLTHTVWFALLVGATLGAMAAGVGWVVGGPTMTVLGGAFGAVVGTLTVLAHLAADLITPAGIRPFAPVSRRRYSLDLVTASNPVANYLLAVVGGLVAVGALALGATLRTALGG